MKVRIYFSISTIILALFLIVGVSFALLSDETVYDDNYISTGNVSINTTLSDETGEVNSIKIHELYNGDTISYSTSTKINSERPIAYRYVLEFDEDYRLLTALEISVDNNNLKFDINNNHRATSAWKHGVTEEFDNTISFHLPMWYSTDIDEKCEFVLKLQAVHDNFVEVSNNKQLSKVVDGEFVKIANDFDVDNLNIDGKSIYLDLNGKSFTTISIRNCKSFEIENGTVTNLTIEKSEKIYYNDTVVVITKEIIEVNEVLIDNKKNNFNI